MPSFCELQYVSVHPTAALRSQQRGDPWLISAKNCEPIPFIGRNYVVSGKMGNLCHVQGQVGSETTQIHQDGFSWLSQGCKSGGGPSTSTSGKAAHAGGIKVASAASSQHRQVKEGGLHPCPKEASPGYSFPSCIGAFICRLAGTVGDFEITGNKTAFLTHGCGE